LLFLRTFWRTATVPACAIVIKPKESDSGYSSDGPVADNVPQTVTHGSVIKFTHRV
jgi:hypothetical protein